MSIGLSGIANTMKESRLRFSISGISFLLALCFISLQSVYWGGVVPESKFEEVGGILVPLNCNAGNHLYPYLATALTCGCILMMIAVIIVFGGDLGTYIE